MISKVAARYRVDLYTLTIGPIHHSIELTNKSGKYFGKLSFDLIFSQLQTIDVYLDELKVQFDEM